LETREIQIETRHVSGLESLIEEEGILSKSVLASLVSRK